MKIRKEDGTEVEVDEGYVLQEGEELVEEDEEKMIDIIANKIEDKLDSKIKAKFGDSFFSRQKRSSIIASKIYNEIDLNDPKSLHGGDKIVGFFKAAVLTDVVSLRALSEGVSADGGYLLPTEFYAELIREIEDQWHMRKLVRVVPMKRSVMQVPKLGSRPKLRWTSELAAKSTTTADFSQPSLTAYKLAAIMYASEELVEDAVEMNVVQLIVSLFADAIAEEEDKVLTQGTGTGQPTGITNCSISSITCVGNLDLDQMIDLIYSLPAKYRANATILSNNANIKELRKMKDGQDRYLWQESSVAGEPATLLGFPIVENNWLSESEIYFGDFKKLYWLGDRKRMSVTISREAGDAWTKDEVGIRVVERIGGNCMLEAACRKLTGIP